MSSLTIVVERPDGVVIPHYQGPGRRRWLTSPSSLRRRPARGDIAPYCDPSSRRWARRASSSKTMCGSARVARPRDATSIAPDAPAEYARRASLRGARGRPRHRGRGSTSSGPRASGCTGYVFGLKFEGRTEEGRKSHRGRSARRPAADRRPGQGGATVDSASCRLRRSRLQNINAKGCRHPVAGRCSGAARFLSCPLDMIGVKPLFSGSTLNDQDTGRASTSPWSLPTARDRSEGAQWQLPAWSPNISRIARTGYGTRADQGDASRGRRRGRCCARQAGQDLGPGQWHPFEVSHADPQGPETT